VERLRKKGATEAQRHRGERQGRRKQVAEPLRVPSTFAWERYFFLPWLASLCLCGRFLVCYPRGGGLEPALVRKRRGRWRNRFAFRWGGRPHGIECQSSLSTQNLEPSMNDITRVAIDTSKAVFTIHAVDAQDRPVLRRNLRRQDVAGFFARALADQSGS
jgi:hypothetical protein